MTFSGYWAIFGFLLWIDTGRFITLGPYDDSEYHNFFNNALYHSSDTTRLHSHSYESRPYSPGQLFTRRLGGAGLFGLAVMKLSTFCFSDPSPSKVFHSFHSVTISCSVLSNLSHAAFLSYALLHAPASAYYVLLSQITILLLEALLIGAPFLLNHVVTLRLKDLLIWSLPPLYCPNRKSHPSQTFSSTTVAGLVMMCSFMISIPLLRDLFLPGQLLTWFPGDVNYMIFTRAYVHSPGGTLNPDYLGDQLSSQWTALMVLLGLVYKVSTIVLIPRGFTLRGKDANRALACNIAPLMELVKPLVDENGNLPSEGDAPPYTFPTGAVTKPSDNVELWFLRTPYGLLKSAKCWRVQSVMMMAVWTTVWRFYHVALESEGYNLDCVLMIVVFEMFIVATYGWLPYSPETDKHRKNYTDNDTIKEE